MRCILGRGLKLEFRSWYCRTLRLRLGHDVHDFIPNFINPLDYFLELFDNPYMGYYFEEEN